MSRRQHVSANPPQKLLKSPRNTFAAVGLWSLTLWGAPIASAEAALPPIRAVAAVPWFARTIALDPTYAPPVDAPITDPFRAPSGPYGPGNRGIEYATNAGEPIGAIGAGRVIFAGQVGGRLYVTVEHPDGLRSSYSWLAAISARVGQQLDTGDPIGVAGGAFHLGVRRPDGTYIDPALLFGPPLPTHAVLDDAYLTVDGP